MPFETSPLGQRCVLLVFIVLEYILDLIHFLMIFGDLGVFFQNANGHTDRHMDGHTDGRTYGQTDPHIEMRGRI